MKRFRLFAFCSSRSASVSRERFPQHTFYPRKSGCPSERYPDPACWTDPRPTTTHVLGRRFRTKRTKAGAGCSSAKSQLVSGEYSPYDTPPWPHMSLHVGEPRRRYYPSRNHFGPPLRITEPTSIDTAAIAPKTEQGDIAGCPPPHHSIRNISDNIEYTTTRLYLSYRVSFRLDKPPRFPPHRHLRARRPQDVFSARRGFPALPRN
jgi:hypothetical protein